jgi:aryl sulfotransferase
MTRPALDGRKLPPLLREACEADERIVTSRLLDEGFDDLPSKGALALPAMSIGGDSAADLMRMMGITPQEAGDLTEALIQGGYLGLRATPDNPKSQRPAVTDRGRAAINAVGAAIKVARYAAFPFREGDVIICALPKSGTTWVQMICALLIFQTPDLPGTLHALSPTLDPLSVPIEVLQAEVAGQEHRRFIKTHLPLHWMTIDPRVTCIAIARHPLDRAISLYHHQRNISPELGKLQSGQAPERHASERQDPERQDPAPHLPPREWLLNWIKRDAAPNIEQLSRAWSRRAEPNIVSLHYADLAAGLETEMHRLAARLGITVPEQLWPSLAKAATFRQMKANAERIQPIGLLRKSLLRSDDAFFRRGTSGSGRELLTPAELADYYERAAQVAPPDLLTWLHRP